MLAGCSKALLHYVCHVPASGLTGLIAGIGSRRTGGEVGTMP